MHKDIRHGDGVIPQRERTGNADALRSLKPYPAYKDSGVEWLGQVPEHWEVKRLRYSVTKCQNGLWGDDPDGINDVVCVRVADFDRVAGEVKIDQLTLRSVNPTILDGRRLRRNDLLLEKSGGGDKQPVGAVVLNTYSELAICSNFIAQMPVQEGFDPRYLTYLHAAMYAARINTRSIKQTTGIQNLDSDNYLNEVAAFPEILEQRAIAAFLDRETARIDALVAKQERLIELLQEKRTSLITQAVTKGLDPDIPMKDSGVEWLGEVPVHWEVKKVTRLFEIGSGTTPPTNYADYYGGDIAWITTSELRESVVMSTNKTVTREALKAFSALSVYPENSVAVAMYGATIGRIGVLGTEAAVNQACCVFSKPNGIDVWFWFYWLQFRRSYLISLGYGGGQPNLSQDLLKAIRVPIPSLPEQRTIASFLDRETAQIDALVAKIRKVIDLLREQRTALISAAVTGKIDVREAMA